MDSLGEAHWTEMRLQRCGLEQFNIARLNADAFCMMLRDTGGTGAYSTDVTVIGVFTDERDALEYVRHFSIPDTLQWMLHEQDIEPLPAESYADRVDDVSVDEVLALLEVVDELIESEEVTEKELESVRRAHNALLAETNPSKEILAWGRLESLLASAWVAESVADLADEYEEDDEQVAALVELVDSAKSGDFDADDPDHFALAADLLERLQSY
jgi:hypothetical protein